VAVWVFCTKKNLATLVAKVFMKYLLLRN
jgi:hypothetical protein